MAKNKAIYKRYTFYWKFFKPLVALFALSKGYRWKGRLKMKKGDSYIILSNHVTQFDGVFLALSFSRPFSILVSDSFFSSGFAKIASHLCGMIPKKKGAVDMKSTMMMMKTIKEGGNLAFYPEGNRTYAEFQFPFSDRFAGFIRQFNKKIVIFNVHGGFGSYPRFGSKRRKGKYYGEIKKILNPEDYAKMSDEEFERLLKDNLKIYDSENGEFYKSKRRAEYLERMLFVCPKCGAVETLHSNGNHLVCSKCGLDVEYTEDLHIRSSEPEFKFNKLIDWYNFQINFVKNFNPTDKPIFKEEFAKFYISNPYEKRKLLAKGSVVLSKDKLVFGDKIEIPVKDIEIASPINGCNFNFSTGSENYLVKGSSRFNPLKYVLMLNRLDSKMKETNADIYYSLNEK